MTRDKLLSFWKMCDANATRWNLIFFSVRWDFMSKEEIPSAGPELESVYMPGTPGAPWTRGEVTTMRTIITMVTTA